MGKEIQNRIDKVLTDVFILKGIADKKCREIMEEMKEIKRLAEKEEK